MKVLYVANFRIPTERAHGIQVVKTCEALANAGAEVELVLPARRNAIADDLFAYYGVNRTFSVVTLSTPDFVRLGPLGFAFSTHAFLFAVRRYARRIPDAHLYTREPLAPLYLPDVIIELHKDTGSRHVLRAIRRSHRLTAITNGLKETYVAHGIPGDRITVIPDGVDYERFAIELPRQEARRATGLPDDAKIALYSGSFSSYAWKGFDVFIAAARALPDVLFIAVGGMQEEAERAAGELPKNVRCEGYQPHARIPTYLRAADVLVLPNKAGDPMSERYTSPLKLFEYMASGTPIVASDLPSIREVVDADSACFTKPGDSAALAHTIRDTLANPGAVRKGAIARERAQTYSWKHRASSIIECLRNSS